MARKRNIDDLADEIICDFDAGDTPMGRAESALQQARDAGDGGVRQQHLRAALRHIAEIDPARDPKAVHRLQAEVLALQGRRGDTRVAHVTPGEVVIPPSLQTPGLMRALEALARQQGIAPASLHVGSGRNAINPRTGQMEFADPAKTREPLYDPVTGIRCPVLEPNVIEGFGSTKGRKEPHSGVDLRNRVGAPVFAPESGVVTSNAPSPRGGNQVILQSDSGMVPGFAHTRPTVKPGERVVSGQQIGISDGSGTEAPHLHMTARPGPGQPRVDPLEYIARACGLIK